MSIDISTSLGDLVTQDPRRTRVLESYGLDYCCGGQQSLRLAAQDKGLDPQDVAAALELPGEAAPLHTATSDLAGQAHAIIDLHHAYLWAEMPRLQALVTKVAGVHGRRHPELSRLSDLYARVSSELELHLAEEERIVFPAISRMERLQAPVQVSGTTLGTAIAALMDEHDLAGELFAQMSRLTGGYETPDDGCASYAAMLAGLQEMEQDLHLHVHKENNVLFPQVLARESDLAAQSRMS